MKKLIFLVIVALVFACQENKSIINKTSSPYIELNNSDSLARFTSNIPVSNDTIFMGFTMGMTKKEYKSHIDKLRKDGIKITYKKNLKRDVLNRIGGVLSRYKGNGAYSFQNGIKREHSSTGKTVSGFAEFYLFPIYNEIEGLVALIVMDKYNWNTKDIFYDKNWLYEQSRESYNETPKVLKEFLDKNEMGYGYGKSDFLIKNNVLVEEAYDGVYYISKKEMFRSIYLKMLDNEILNQQSDKLTF